MNRGRLVAAFGIGFLTVAGALSRAATLPVDSQDAGSLKPQIGAFLQTQIAAVGGADAAASSTARNAIVAETVVTIPTQPQPSQTFLNTYTDALATSLDPLLQSQDARVRLNAAIIVARVAEHANNTRLAETVVKLINDPSVAVAQWGMHAAQFVLPPLLSNPVQAKQVNLLPTLVEVVTKHVSDGSLVEAAYYALQVSDRGTTAVSPAQWNTVVPQIAEAIQAIMEKRIALYQQNIPTMPDIEQIPIAYLASDRVWHALTPAAQNKTIELMCHLISDAAQRGGPAGINDRSELVDLLRHAASAFLVISDFVKDAGLETAAKQLQSVNTGTPTNYVPAATAVTGAVTKVTQFKGITIAPPLPASMPSSGPSTQP